MESKQREIELILLGYCLANPAAAESLGEFSSGDIGYAVGGIKGGDLQRLRTFLYGRNVQGETFELLRIRQRRNWIEAEIGRLMRLGTAAKSFRLNDRTAEVIKKLEGMRRELEAITLEEKEALSKLRVTDGEEKNPAKAGPGKTGPGQIGPGPLPGSKPGVRIQGPARDGSAGGPRSGKPGPAPHSADPPRSAGVPDKPLPPMPRSRTQ